MVPFFSNRQSFQHQWGQLEPLLDRLIDQGVYSNGAMVGRFERTMEAFTGAKHAIGVSNGTSALIISLMAAGIQPGDEVIVPPFTFFASASSIAHVGATPVFADIEPGAYALDPEAVRARITAKTKAIMPVHLFTQVADLPALKAIAEEAGVAILEDSAEAIGMWCDGIHAGLWGRAGILSFFPTKTLGGIGDGGMILTHDDEVAETCRLLRDHGRRPANPYVSEIVGLNEKMDEIQAAVLYTRLQSLSADLDKRAALARFYNERLSKLDGIVKTPDIVTRPFETNPVYYVYVIEAPERDALAAHLNASGIGTEIYYPIPLHQQPCFAHLGYRDGDFPVAEAACRRTLALPFYPDLSHEQAEFVCQVIELFYTGRNRS